MNYEDTINYIMSSLPMFQRTGGAAYKANLNNTIALLDYLNNPQEKFKSVHIAGTNGKGSVSHCLASIFQEAGYKTGLYTSPDLADFRERIRLNGNMIEKSFITEFINKHKDFLNHIKPSFFEMSVGLAFDYFSKKNIDIAIIETGMGGRLDSTNLISPELSIITNIGYDHTQFLGNTLKEIATEKAGIIKNKIPVLIGESNAETKNVFISKANEKNSEIYFADNIVKHEINSQNLLLPKLDINIQTKKYKYRILSPLAPDYQIKNIKTIVAAAEILRNCGYKILKNNIANGIKNVVINTNFKGRWSIFGKKTSIIMDTAHNVDGLEYISKTLKSLKCDTLRMVIGMVDDKEHEKMLKILPKNAKYYICKPNVPRGFDEKRLLEITKKIGLNSKCFSSVKIALKEAKKDASPNDIIYVGGSTFTVADAIT